MFFGKSLWHASPYKFDEFDFSKVGVSSLKYGYGIYFSFTKEKAKSHVVDPKHLYRVDLSRTAYRGLLSHTEQIKFQSDPVKKAAEALKTYSPLSKWNDIGMLYVAGGISLYQAACNSAAGSAGVDYEEKGARLLVTYGILGAIANDNHEEIVTLFDPATTKVAYYESL